MAPDRPQRVILMADDDDDDRLLVRDALAQCGVTARVDFVHDGVELMEYLERRGPFEGQSAISPVLILLDLNMPRKDGREALLEIKANRNLRHIPVVVLTTSTNNRDVTRSYEIGANTYIPKPPTFDGLVDLMKMLEKYWLDTALVPICKLGNDNDEPILDSFNR